MQTGALRFLADESCAASVIRALREDGHDVYALSEVMQRTIDEVVLGQSVMEGRILLTEDKDFGALVFMGGAESAGIIFMRFPQHTRRTLVESVRRAVQQHGDALIGAFVVIQPGLVRFSRERPPRDLSTT